MLFILFCPWGCIRIHLIESFQLFIIDLPISSSQCLILLLLLCCHLSPYSPHLSGDLWLGKARLLLVYFSTFSIVEYHVRGERLLGG